VHWLNYHHLYYFSVIAQEGGIAPAARKLRLTHSTLSTQLRALEEHFGAPLFERRGKRLVLTPFGADAVGYSTDIFRLGQELNDVARGRGVSSRHALRVGLVQGIPKTLAQRLLAPALDPDDQAVLIRQDGALALLEALVGGRLHLVIMNDVPTPPVGTKMHVHRLGETNILFFARAPLARTGRFSFPSGLSKVPLVLPPPGAPLRRKLDAWFAKHNIVPKVKAEVDDSGLLRALGAAGVGAIPVRSALRAEVEDLWRLHELGSCKGVAESYYAVTTELRTRHPGVAAIIDVARAGLNAPEPKEPKRRGRV